LDKGVCRSDIQAAIHFRLAAEENQIKRIIYLGGLGDRQTNFPPPAKRIQVSEELKKGEIRSLLCEPPSLRSGSASYEIIQSLVRRLPIIFIPRWHEQVPAHSDPRRDKYLVGVLEIPKLPGSL